MQVGLINGDAMTGQAANGGQVANAPSPRLVQSAHEFEGQMLKELLEPMTRVDALAGDEDDLDSGAGSGGALSEFASEALGQALSERGGFGIADRLIKQLSQSGNQHDSGKVTSNLHGNTVLRTSE